MFEHTSRYYNQKKLRFMQPDGRVISYVSRRIVPSRDYVPTLAEVSLSDGQRLDTIAAATLGDPELFWRICDANSALHPFDLVSEVGRVIKVPMPGSLSSP